MSNLLELINSLISFSSSFNKARLMLVSNLLLSNKLVSNKRNAVLLSYQICKYANFAYLVLNAIKSNSELLLTTEYKTFTDKKNSGYSNVIFELIFERKNDSSVNEKIAANIDSLYLDRDFINDLTIRKNKQGEKYITFNALNRSNEIRSINLTRLRCIKLCNI